VNDVPSILSDGENVSGVVISYYRRMKSLNESLDYVESVPSISLTRVDR
jgi:hypothetical protein